MPTYIAAEDADLPVGQAERGREVRPGSLLQRQRRDGRLRQLRGGWERLDGAQQRRRTPQPRLVQAPQLPIRGNPTSAHNHENLAEGCKPQLWCGCTALALRVVEAWGASSLPSDASTLCSCACRQCSAYATVHQGQSERGGMCQSSMHSGRTFRSTRCRTCCWCALNAFWLLKPRS